MKVYHTIVYLRDNLAENRWRHERSVDEKLKAVNYSGGSFREKQTKQYLRPIDEVNAVSSEHLHWMDSWRPRVLKDSS